MIENLNISTATLSIALVCVIVASEFVSVSADLPAASNLFTNRPTQLLVDDDPTNAGAVSLQTVAVGRSASFKCVVNNLAQHRIAWFHQEQRVLLAVDNRTLVWKDRVRASTQANSVFTLQINNIKLSDKGHFMCQLSTQPPQIQKFLLDVVQSPQIKEQDTTTNPEPVKEFNSIELRCVADGIPKPVIKWRRESHSFELPAFFNDDDHADEQVVQKSATSQRQQQGNEIDDDVTNSARQQRHERATGGGANELRKVATLSRLNPQLNVDFYHNNDQRPQAKGDDYWATASQNKTLERAKQQRRKRRWYTQTSVATNLSTMSTQQTTSAPTNNTAKGAFLAEGEVLRIERVSRYDMGYYECIAFNGVPPSVAQRIFLPVSYAQRPVASATSNDALLSIEHDQASSGSSRDGITAEVVAAPVTNEQQQQQQQQRVVTSSSSTASESIARHKQQLKLDNLPNKRKATSAWRQQQQSNTSAFGVDERNVDNTSLPIRASVGSGRNGYTRHKQLLKAARSSSSSATTNNLLSFNLSSFAARLLISLATSVLLFVREHS